MNTGSQHEPIGAHASEFSAAIALLGTVRKAVVTRDSLVLSPVVIAFCLF